MPKDVNIGEDISRRNESSSTNILFFFFPRIYIDTWNKKFGERARFTRYNPWESKHRGNRVY